MGITFNNFPIKGFDVSQFQDVIDWDKVASYDPDFTAIRVGYGRSTDTQFNTNWTRSKGKTFRIAYWYMDYYSNHNSGTAVYGMSDAAWGKEQANYCWNQIKNDYDTPVVFLDIENGGTSYSPPIATVTNRAQTIARAFLEEMDRLNGKFNCIYCSLGLLEWFGSWFKNRPLWVAWYNEMMFVNGVYIPRTGANVLINVKAKGWTGKCLMWQYASDGDLNDDGMADGIAVGMGSKALDLNAWIETQEEWESFRGAPIIPVPEPPVSNIPQTSTYQMGKTLVNGQNMRFSPSISSVSVGKINAGVVLPLLAYAKDIGGNPWLRIGHNQWIAQQYGPTKFVERVYVE